MRPNVEKSQDPLDIKALPWTGGMELEYRTSALSPQFDQFIAKRRIASIAAVGLITALGLRLLGTVGHVHHIFACALLLCFVVATRRSIWAFRPRQTALYIVIGAGLWLCSFLAHEMYASITVLLLIYWIAIAACVITADQLATHFAYWLTANPFASTKKRREWRSLWARRFANPLERIGATLSRDQDADTSDKLSEYALGIALVVVSQFIGLLIAIPAANTPFAGIVVVVASTLCMIAIASLYIGLNATKRTHPLRTLWLAIVCWFTYNMNDCRAAGLFQSPVGWCRPRATLTYACIMFLAATSLPLAKYLPVFAATAGPQAWADLTQTRGDFTRKNSPSESVDLRIVEARLSRHEKDLARRLSIPERTAFLNRAASKQNLQSLPPPFYADTPEAWFLGALDHMSNAPTYYSLALLLSLILCLAWPILTLGTIAYLMAGKVLHTYYRELEIPHRHAEQRPDRLWDAYTEALRHSEHFDDRRQIREREHLWLGVNPVSDYPVLLHRDILKEHGWILGDSGAGKTSVAFAPLITQLLRMRNPQFQPLSEIPPPDEPSILILDLKGEMNLFETARIEAERAGLEFKCFTNDQRLATHGFNPLAQSHIQSLSENQRAEVIMQALGLEYGEFYGGNYFAAVNEHVLRRLLEAYHDINSFSQLHHYSTTQDFRKPAVEQSRIERKMNLLRDAAHIIVEIETLAKVPQLNLTAEDYPGQTDAVKQAIDFAALVDPSRRPQVVYFYLSTAIENATVQTIARLALYSLLTAASLRPPGNNRQVFVFIDEFQRIVAPNLALILQQARSRGIGIVLANQVLTDLQVSPTLDLLGTVEGNTRFKQILAASALAQSAYLADISGESHYETRATSKTFSVGGLGASDSFTSSLTQSIGPRFSKNDIASITDRELASIVHVTRSKGFTQFKGLPFELRSSFHIPLATYEERKRASWPTVAAGTFIAADLPSPQSRHGKNELSPAEAEEARKLIALGLPAEPLIVDDEPPPDSHAVEQFDQRLAIALEQEPQAEKVKKKRTKRKRT